MSSAPIDTPAEIAAEREVQALDPALEERIKARTATLEAEISARRRLEDELRTRNAHLERQIADCATEIRAAYNALRESESRFRAIFNHVSDGILIQDPETGESSPSMTDWRSSLAAAMRRCLPWASAPCWPGRHPTPWLTPAGRSNCC